MSFCFSLRRPRAAWIPVLLLAASCGEPVADPPPEAGPGDTALVARVGSYDIDLGDVRRAATRLHGEGTRLSDLPEDRRRAVLDALVASRLLALEAERRGLHESKRVVTPLDSLEHELLLEAIYQRDVWSRARAIPEAEIRALYEEWGGGEQIEAAHILVRTRQEADEVLALLAGGADFAKLARGRSTHAMSSMRGGSMGFLRRGMIPRPIAEAVWNAPAGTVYPEPIRTSMGWHVVEVRRRRRVALAVQRSEIVNELERRQRLRLETEFRGRLARQFELVYHPETTLAVASLQDTISGDRPLFEWRGGRLDLAGFLRRARVPDPVSQDTARMRSLAERVAYEDLAVQAARQLGYQNLASVQNALAHKRFQLLGDLVYDTETRPGPTDQELREYFAGHRERFRGPPRVRVREILVDTRAEADSLYGLIQAGHDMAQLARRHTVRSDLARTGGLWEEVSPNDPRAAKIHRLALASGEGLHEPVKVPGGFSVFEVLSIRSGRLPSFEAAAEAVREAMAADRMDRLIERLRRELADRIRIYPEAL